MLHFLILYSKPIHPALDLGLGRQLEGGMIVHGGVVFGLSAKSAIGAWEELASLRDIQHSTSRTEIKGCVDQAGRGVHVAVSPDSLRHRSD